MISTRAASRLAASRGTTSLRSLTRRQIRLQSSSTGNAAGNNSYFAAGAAGGLVGAALIYGISSFTPAGQTASKINTTAKEVDKKYREAAKKLQANTPTSDEAVDSIKQFAYSYVGWIPGGKAYIDAAFKDWETVRKNHREEADQVINDAYKQFQEVSKSGLSLETASRAFEVLTDVAIKVADLAGDALTDVLDNHPQVKDKIGGNVDKLKQMGDQYGPEAKKQVDETWKQVKDVFASGFSESNLDKARKLVEDKIKQIQKLGDEAWSKGLEEAKPYLDKSSKVKELVEKNADALKQGNLKELFDKARSAVDSGDSKDLEGFINNAVQKVGPKISQLPGDLDKYLKQIPQAGGILDKLQQLGQVAEKHKEEGQKLLNETVEELGKILDEKAKKAREIVDSAKKDVR